MGSNNPPAMVPGGVRGYAEPMDLSPPQALLCLGLPWLLGMALLRLLGLDRRSDALAFWGWSWVLGALGSALLLGLWLAFGGSLGTGSAPALLLLFASAGAYSLGRRLRPSALEPLPEARRLKGPRWERMLFQSALLFALLVSLDRVLEGSQFAVFSSDEALRWGLAAKQLFLGSSLEVLGERPQVPPLNPLLQAWGFHCAGALTPSAQRLLLQAFSPALVLLLAAALRCVVRPGVAAALLLIACGLTPFISAAWLGSSDLMLGVGALIGLDGLLRWRRDRERAWLCLSGCGMLLALGADWNGIWVWGALLVAWAWRGLGQRIGNRRALGLALLCALALFLARRGFSPSPGHELQEHLFEHVLFGRWRSAYLLFAASLLALVFLWRGLSRELTLCAYGIVGWLLCLSLLPEGLTFSPAWIADSGELLIVVLPAAMLWIAACAGAQLGLSPSTHDPRRAARELGALRPLRSILLGYLIAMALSSTASAGLHLVQSAAGTLRQVRSSTPETRLANAMLQADALQRWSPGSHASLNATLEAQLAPSDALALLVLQPGDQRLASRWSAFLFPRELTLLDGPAELAAAGATQPWILCFGEAAPGLLGAHRVVSSGEAWSLWRAH